MNPRTTFRPVRFLKKPATYFWSPVSHETSYLFLESGFSRNQLPIFGNVTCSLPIFGFFIAEFDNLPVLLIAEAVGHACKVVTDGIL